MLNKKFLQALKESEKPLHQIAWESGLTPNQVYRISCGIERPHRGCPKVEALCRHLGFPLEDAFQEIREAINEK